MDFLVSRFSNKLNKFVARSRDPQAFKADALVMLWNQSNLIYTFLPHQILRPAGSG